MEQPLIAPGGDLLIGLAGLCQGQLLGKGYHTVQVGIVLFEPFQEKLRELQRGDLARLEQGCQLPYRVESQVFFVLRPAYFLYFTPLQLFLLGIGHKAFG